MTTVSTVDSGGLFREESTLVTSAHALRGSDTGFGAESSTLVADLTATESATGSEQLGDRTIVLEEAGVTSDVKLTARKTTINVPGQRRYPVVKIFGPAVGPYIKNLTTGGELNWSTLTLELGEILVVDLKRQVARLDGGRLPIPDDAGGWWSLANEDNELEIGGVEMVPNTIDSSGFDETPRNGGVVIEVPGSVWV